MGKLFLLTSFTVLTPIVLVLNIISLSYLAYQKNPHTTFGQSQSNTVAYAALPPIQNIAVDQVTEIDARVEMVRQFFAKYRSPLEPYAKDVVYYADLYNLDFRLIPSIAMQESNLCLKAPPDSNNCWGYGIYNKKVIRFDSYTEGIQQVTKTLATVYRKSGLDTPEEIMTRYTPSSQGSWANGVSHFMEQLQ